MIIITNKNPKYLKIQTIDLGSTLYPSVIFIILLVQKFSQSKTLSVHKNFLCPLKFHSSKNVKPFLLRPLKRFFLVFLRQNIGETLVISSIVSTFFLWRVLFRRRSINICALSLQKQLSCEAEQNRVLSCEIPSVNQIHQVHHGFLTHHLKPASSSQASTRSCQTRR